MVGALVFQGAGLPLPWMLGAMASSSLVSIAGWRRLVVPASLRLSMQTVVGVNLGAKFSRELVANAWSMAWSLAGLLLFASTATALGYAFLRRFAGYDPATAFFSSVPGGLNDMVIVSGEMGGDQKIVGLTHVCRLVIVVSTFPLIIRASPSLSAGLMLPEASTLVPTLLDTALLCLSAALGPQVGRILRLPARYVVGPMLVSAALHMAEAVVAHPPSWTLRAAQVVIATSVGCRFAGIEARQLRTAFVSALGSTGILMATAAVFSAAAATVTGFPWPLQMLAYSPGGISEACITALAMGFDAAFIATHHVIRIGFLVIVSPLLFQAANAKKRASTGRCSTNEHDDRAGH